MYGSYVSDWLANEEKKCKCYQWIFLQQVAGKKLAGDAGIWTRGLLHAKQALYHWATSPMVVTGFAK